MRRLVVESAVLLALVIASAFTLSALESQLSLASGAVATMAMLAAATSVAAGFAAEMVARLSEQSSLRRIAAAMMLYGMVVVPTTASGLAATTLDTIVVIAIRHTATLLTITLLLLAVVPFDRPHPWPIRPFRNPATGLRGLLVAAVCSLASGGLAAAFPEAAYLVVRSPILFSCTALLWLNVALTCLVIGVLRRNRMLVWLSFGQLAIVLAHAPRFWSGDSLFYAPPLYSPLLAPGMRVLGTTLVLPRSSKSPTVPTSGPTSTRSGSPKQKPKQWRHANGSPPKRTNSATPWPDWTARPKCSPWTTRKEKWDRAALRAALSAELNRMRAMLSPQSEHTRNDTTRLRSLLKQLVLIRRSNGTAIDLTVDGDPVVAMPQDAVAQVITNILANCERHAPGAHVWVETYGSATPWCGCGSTTTGPESCPARSRR